MPGVVPIGIDADHFSICKPRSRDDLIYKSIRRTVEALEDENSSGNTVPRAEKAPRINGTSWPPADPVSLLRQVNGKQVAPGIVPIQLVRSVAEACSDRGEALLVVQQAEQWLLEAGEIEGVLLRLEPQFLQDFGQGSLQYWILAFTKAAVRGARVLVALLAALPPTVVANHREAILRVVNVASPGLLAS